VLLQVKNISKNFLVNDDIIEVLNNLSFTVNLNDIVSIYGPSGSGKSTLLNIIAGLIKSDSGSIIFDDKNLKTESDFIKLRKNKLGIVFQEHHLLSEFTSIENIMLPQLISGLSKKESYKVAYELLEEFNLLSRKDFYPNKLSVGEKQRISILRAVINKPKLIIADEPTGSVDERNKEKIFSLFKKISRNYDCALLIVTHDNNVSKISNKILNLSRGQIK